jgi:tetratricopeptide (TPR) repeat protein
MRFLRRWLGPRTPKTPADPLTRGMAALASGDSNEALTLLSSLGSSDPANGEAQLGLGMLYLRQFSAQPQVATLNDAVTSLTRAVELLPDSPEAYFYLALAESFTLDTIDEAEQHLARALQLDPQLAERAAEIETRIAAAKADMQQQAIDPEIIHQAVQRYESGQRLVESGQLAEAAAAFEQAVEVYPAYVEALLALGDTYRQLGRSDDAVRTLRRALAVRPRMLEAHIALGSLYVQRGDHARALEQLSLALAQAPDQPQLLRNVGLLQLATGASDAAAATFRRLCALQPSDPEPRLHLTQAALQSGDEAAARDAFARIADLTLSAKQHARAAQLAAQLGDEVAAERHRRQAGPEA